MINKLNTFSALARVMLSGAVVALLVMAAPSAVMAQESPHPFDFEWCTSEAIDPANDFWSVYDGSCNPNDGVGFGSFSLEINDRGEAHFFSDPPSNGPIDFYCWGSGELEVSSETGLNTILDCSEYTHFVFETPTFESVNFYAVSTNTGHVFIDGEYPTSSITGNFDAANVFTVAGDVLTLFAPIIAILAGIGLGFLIYAYLLRYLRSR